MRALFLLPLLAAPSEGGAGGAPSNQGNEAGGAEDVPPVEPTGTVEGAGDAPSATNTLLIKRVRSLEGRVSSLGEKVRILSLLVARLAGEETLSNAIHRHLGGPPASES